jgi:hypothetical protein
VCKYHERAEHRLIADIIAKVAKLEQKQSMVECPECESMTPGPLYASASGPFKKVCKQCFDADSESLILEEFEKIHDAQREIAQVNARREGMGLSRVETLPARGRARGAIRRKPTPRKPRDTSRSRGKGSRLEAGKARGHKG